MDAVAIAEAHYHISFKKVGPTEYRSMNGCPQCGDGGKGARSDRFRLFDDEKPRVWCRRCGFTAFIDNLDNARELTEAEKLELRLQAIERKQQETERRLSALEAMARCTDHLAYHRNMSDAAWLYWNQQGMLNETITRYQLGYCQRCPLDHDGRASYTIPVINGGKLRNIRHRIIDATNGDKYRPHRAGLPATLFNADNVSKPAPSILILEGEKKSIIADQSGFLSVGTMGAASFNPAWARRFQHFQTVYVAYDPDAIEKAADTARLFGTRGRVVAFPEKFDDFVTIYGATAEDVRHFVSLARKI